MFRGLYLASRDLCLNCRLENIAWSLNGQRKVDTRFKVRIFSDIDCRGLTSNGPPGSIPCRFCRLILRMMLRHPALCEDGSMTTISEDHLYHAGLYVVVKNECDFYRATVFGISIYSGSTRSQLQSALFSSHAFAQVPGPYLIAEDQVDFGSIQNWLQQCNSHKHCRGSDSDYRPKHIKLIDVDRRKGVWSTADVRFMALSYTWGVDADEQSFHLRKAPALIDPSSEHLDDIVEQPAALES